jgi:hypothetical protein
MKRSIVLFFLLTTSTGTVIPQARLTGPSWDGYVKRGRVHVRAGGSLWTANGISVSHTQEIYDSPEAAQYVLSRLKGRMLIGSEVAVNTESTYFKVTTRKSQARIAWVCGNDLHYIEAKTYEEATEFFKIWGFKGCR